MKKTKNYNWWQDPANWKEVQELSWWEHNENKITVPFPLSAIQNPDGSWTVSGNRKTEKLVGDTGLSQVATSYTKEDAIEEYFKLMKFVYETTKEDADRYERWVPFLKGPWSSIGGKWFQVFGIMIYFRTGKNMKGGWYVPFTNLNITITNKWKSYQRNLKRNG